MAVVEKGPTQVQEVLAKGPVPNPFPTLDVARNDSARQEKIRQVRKLIDEKGIKYIFFQQVSVSGHVNGKGVAATQWERVAEAGYQLVYGATADLFAGSSRYRSGRRQYEARKPSVQSCGTSTARTRSGPSACS